jgi:hypothetical protein
MPRIMDSFKKFNNDFMCQFRDSDNILPRLWGSAAIAETIAPKLTTSQKVSVNIIVHVESITTLCMSAMCTYDHTMKKAWKCHAASNWADGLYFKYSNCMKVNCLLALPVYLSLFLPLFCVYLLSLFLCPALVSVSVSQWILLVKNCGAIVVLEI